MLKLLGLVNGKIINLMPFKMIPIKGDASSRKFYRLQGKKNNKIFVSAKKEKYKNLVAYSAINRFLRNNKILAPKLYSHNFNKGYIVIQDFGKLTFYELIKRNKNKLKIYKKLVDLLLKIQNIKPKSKIKNIIGKPHKIKKYSKDFLFKESNLFFDWYLPLFLTRKKAINMKKNTNFFLSQLYNSLYFSNTCLVHRDYHAQNLMKFGNKIAVIDSKDVIIGNPAYDLVSLIDDVRINTSAKLKKKIYEYYIKKNLKIKSTEKKHFLKDFDILSVQRSLKIIGIFARLYKRDNKDKYLKLIPYTWKLLEKRISSKAFLQLKHLLDVNIPQLIRKKIIN